MDRLGVDPRARRGCRRRRIGATGASLQTEVVLSLALVMLAATTLLAAALLQGHEARWRDLLGRGLRAESQAPPVPESALIAGTEWWYVHGDGAVRSVWGKDEPLDGETLALAEQVHAREEPLLRPGAAWQSIRFAAPAGPDRVAVARLPKTVSLRLRVLPLVLAGVLLALDVALFTAFGASILRRRVVLPLRRLADAARGLAAGSFGARVPEEGPREASEVAAAFNDMSDALARRTEALEKAVVELRDANAELRHTRAGLDRAERLAAVGRLAAGVAHEVGNPMGALLAFVDLAERDPGLAPASRDHLARAIQQGERVRRILRQLLDFARPAATSAAVPVDLVAVAEETALMIRSQSRTAGLRVEVEVEGNPPPALGDAGRITQILLNLALNAADAVGIGGGSGVRMLVRAVPLTLRAGALPAEALARRRADGVECVVADDGCGIAAADRERIFDPFFTTKDPGKGTGLGLSNSLRLAEEMGGRLEFVPPPEGLSTAFALRLPAAGSFDDSARSCGVRRKMRGSETGDSVEAEEKNE